MNRYWLWFWLGVLAPFVVKYANYMLQETGVIQATVPKTNIVLTGRRWSFLIATARFLFADTTVAIKTLTNLGAEWVIGAVVIDKLPVPFAVDLFEMPQHIGLAFFTGLIAESMIVPPLMNFIVGRFAKKEINP